MLKYSSYRSIYSESEHAPKSSPTVVVGRLRRIYWFKVATLLLVMLITTTGMVTAFASGSSEEGATYSSYEEIIIMPGDTLWSVALNHKVKGQDTRAFIHEVKKINGMKSSSVQAGQFLLIPNQH